MKAEWPVKSPGLLLTGNRGRNLFYPGAWQIHFAIAAALGRGGPSPGS